MDPTAWPVPQLETDKITGAVQADTGRRRMRVWDGSMMPCELRANEGRGRVGLGVV